MRSIVREEVVYTFSSFRFPEHKSAHLKFFLLPSRTYGSIPVPEVVLTCDIALLPSLDKYGIHTIVWSPLEFCCSGLRWDRRKSPLWHETSSSVAPHGCVTCGRLSSSALVGCAWLGNTNSRGRSWPRAGICISTAGGSTPSAPKLVPWPACWPTGLAAFAEHAHARGCHGATTSSACA